MTRLKIEFCTTKKPPRGAALLSNQNQFISAMGSLSTINHVHLP